MFKPSLCFEWFPKAVVEWKQLNCGENVVLHANTSFAMSGDHFANEGSIPHAEQIFSVPGNDRTGTNVYSGTASKMPLMPCWRVTGMMKSSSVTPCSKAASPENLQHNAHAFKEKVPTIWRMPFSRVLHRPLLLARTLSKPERVSPVLLIQFRRHAGNDCHGVCVQLIATRFGLWTTESAATKIKRRVLLLTLASQPNGHLLRSMCPRRCAEHQPGGRLRENPILPGLLLVDLVIAISVAPLCL